MSPDRPGARWWRRGVVAFGRFWWDFLVGETPELLIGAALAVGGAALLVHSGAVRAVVVGSLPVLVIGILSLSTVRGRSRARDRERTGPDGGGSPTSLSGGSGSH